MSTKDNGETATGSTKVYFTTRDLLMMAALAALGGVTGTYVNTIGDFVQSVVGFAGTTQWAAGLHVVWLTLAMGLVTKPGAGTIAGLLKGVVELLSGNSHGVLVLLVDIIAGLFIDLGFLPFKRKDNWLAFALAGGLAAASNVLVFQLFAALPADILAYGAILVVSGIAFLSGVVFAGVLGWMLLNALRRTGAVRDAPAAPTTPKARAIAIAAALILTVSIFAYVKLNLQGPEAIEIAGAVNAPYAYPADHGDLQPTTVEATLRETTTRYTGIHLRDIIALAEPEPDGAMVLIQAVDGYAFFVTLDEVRQNDSLILAVQGKGKDATYNIVGAESPKAWVRNVAQLAVVGGTALDINGALAAPAPYSPSDWQADMDSTTINLESGAQKLQGTALRRVLETMGVDRAAATVAVHTPAGDAPTTIPLASVLADDDIRIFTVIDTTGVTYAVAHMTGEVIAAPATAIEIQ